VVHEHKIAHEQKVENLKKVYAENMEIVHVHGRTCKNSNLEKKG